ncbi:MAG: hypothetical protein RJA10_542 [Pseudomonadota bacterium]|jgi:hypothetical protein
MTAQAKELILLDETFEWTYGLPLEPYLAEHGIDMRQIARCRSSGCWRGYEAVWEIAGDDLYLIGLLEPDGQPYDPAVVFGDRPLPIRADWFSGRIEIGQGDALTYHHMNAGHSHSTVLRLYVRCGRVVARRRYDQTRLLRRHFERFVAANPNWLEILEAEARDDLQPLGGLTAAGVKALGRPELEREGLQSTWPGGLSSAETAEIAACLLRHCTRVLRT